MSTRPRMSDLAESAGVSISTVSRVLNGKPGIREDTRQAVLQAMTDLGYSREKLQQRSGVIGLVVPELLNPSFPAFAERLDAIFQTGHRTVITAAGPSGTNEATCIITLLDLGVDGVISISGAQPTPRPTSHRICGWQRRVCRRCSSTVTPPSWTPYS